MPSYSKRCKMDIFAANNNDSCEEARGRQLDSENFDAATKHIIDHLALFKMSEGGESRSTCASGNTNETKQTQQTKECSEDSSKD